MGRRLVGVEPATTRGGQGAEDVKHPPSGLLEEEEEGGADEEMSRFVPPTSRRSSLCLGKRGFP